MSTNATAARTNRTTAIQTGRPATRKPTPAAVLTTSPKTASTNRSVSADRAGELHPYDVPCVIALPLVDGNPAYLRWIAAETRDP